MESARFESLDRSWGDRRGFRPLERPARMVSDGPAGPLPVSSLSLLASLVSFWSFVLRALHLQVTVNGISQSV